MLANGVGDDWLFGSNALDFIFFFIGIPLRALTVYRRWNNFNANAFKKVFFLSRPRMEFQMKIYGNACKITVTRM